MICKNIKHSIFLSVLFFVGSVQGGYAQEASDMETVPEMQAASFTPPFDFPIVFSGNFGEIRANHFHGGLDFKTGGANGISHASALPTVRAMCSMWITTTAIPLSTATSARL